MTTVVITIPWFHPAFRAGGPVQSIANMVNEYHKDISYRIICGDTDLNNVTLENIETGKWVDYNSCTKVWYAGIHNRSESILEQIKKIKPDILFAIGIYDWHFNIVPLVFSKVPTKIISVRGMLHPGALSQKGWKKKFFLGTWNLVGLPKKVIFHATDASEEQFIYDAFGNDVSVRIASNFPRRFNPSYTKKDRGTLQLISIALISPMKNHLMVLQALEHCHEDISYHICGPVKDMEYWQQCLLQMKQLPANIKVHYHGEVQPQVIEQFIKMADVFILPSKSENFGHAIYEALSAGKPVITSTHTPWNNLEEHQAGINVNLQVEDITNAIKFFVAMEEVFGSWQAGAVNYAAKSIDLDKVRVEYASLFSIKPLSKN